MLPLASRLSLTALTVAVALSVVAPSVRAQAVRDGRTFDTGHAMSEPASGAPKELGQAVGLLGRWTVALESGTGDAQSTASCQAEITLFNRGHGYKERFHCADWNGRGESLWGMTLMTYNPAAEFWVRGDVSSVNESVTVSQGRMQNGELVLRDASRPGGGALLREARLTWRLGQGESGGGGHVLLAEHSTDGGRTWQTDWRRTYTPTEETPALALREDVGEAAPGMPPEARQFDFLIGEWTAQNALTFPNGQTAQWQANATGVFALGGHAVLEYNWFDLDPQLPDAATTIVRIYNRAMRRWESLFMPNRGHSILHFGGRWEGDRMVLHLFGVDTASPTISRFVFHSIESDRFGWYAEGSTDCGATFSKSWVIDTVRKAPPAE